MNLLGLFDEGLAPGGYEDLSVVAIVAQYANALAVLVEKVLFRDSHLLVAIQELVWLYDTSIDLSIEDGVKPL